MQTGASLRVFAGLSSRLLSSVRSAASWDGGELVQGAGRGAWQAKYGRRRKEGEKKEKGKAS